MEIGLIILVFGLIIALRLIAGGNIPYLSAFIRWWWNIGFKITSHIPFCGWMAHFIITKGDKKAEQEKLHYINIGKQQGPTIWHRELYLLSYNNLSWQRI